MANESGKTIRNKAPLFPSECIHRYVKWKLLAARLVLVTLSSVTVSLASD